MRDDKSTWRKQAAGIRQGSPLSPYFFHLFTIVMAALFSDIRHALDGIIFFSHVLYADDTLILEQIHNASTRIDTQLKKIWNAWRGGQLIWVPIKGNLMYTSPHQQAWGGQLVPRKKPATYLCRLVGQCTEYIEDCIATCGSMKPFWNKASTSPL